LFEASFKFIENRFKFLVLRVKPMKNEFERSGFPGRRIRADTLLLKT
jgi:hypothetical protein